MAQTEELMFQNVAYTPTVELGLLAHKRRVKDGVGDFCEHGQEILILRQVECGFFVYN